MLTSRSTLSLTHWPSGSRSTPRSSTSGRTGPGNLLEVVTVVRDDRTEIVINAVRMRRSYESFLRDKGTSDD